MACDKHTIKEGVDTMSAWGDLIEELEEAIQSTVKDLIAEAKEQDEKINRDDLYDMLQDQGIITELVDGIVPVYDDDLFELASENYEIGHKSPELGPAFGGEATPINIIAANVFEELESMAWDYVSEYLDLLETENAFESDEVDVDDNN